jgi:hypothetical protein
VDSKTANNERKLLFLSKLAVLVLASFRFFKNVTPANSEGNLYNVYTNAPFFLVGGSTYSRSGMSNWPAVTSLNLYITENYKKIDFFPNDNGTKL